MNEKQQTTANLWEKAEIIHSYSRAQALEDGVLVDLTEWAKEAGFSIPVAVTRGVWNILDPSPELQKEGQDVAGRAWDMLVVLRVAIQGISGSDEVHFAPLFIRKPGGPAVPVRIWSKVGPGDRGEPVLTVMLQGNMCYN